MSYIPAFPVTGRNGVTLSKLWADFPFTYKSIMSSGFPNYFHIMVGFDSAKCEFGIATGLTRRFLEFGSHRDQTRRLRQTRFICSRNNVSF